MECPHCHSDDVTRSRRRFLDRIALPVLRAEVFRCRDCKKRFWVNVQWSTVILGCMTAMVTLVVIVAMVATHRNRVEESEREAAAPIRRARPFRQAFPKGLPPLSSVPSPKDDAGFPAK
jgi:hypothetical protein